MNHKNSVVKGLADGIDYLFKKNSVNRLVGTASLAGKTGDHWNVQITDGASVTTIQSKNVILAMGSEVVELPFLKFDGKYILSSTETLALNKVPEHLIVIGAGFIGLEMASVWSRLGAKVSIIEMKDRLLESSDEGAAKELEKALKKQGFEFHFKTACKGAKVLNEKVVLEIEKNSKLETITGDCVLVAVGRRPLSESAQIIGAGVLLDNRKKVIIDKNYQTNLPGIYAVGDLISGPMLAHKASEEAVAVVEKIAGHHGHVNYKAIPSVCYTSPEYASVGSSEEELKAAGAEYKRGVFPFSANAKSRSLGETEGFIKILSDSKTDRILGVHIVGVRASEMIPAAVIAIEFGGSSEDVARTCFAHPTLPEAFKEAALDIDKRRLHL